MRFACRCDSRTVEFKRVQTFCAQTVFRTGAKAGDVSLKQPGKTALCEKKGKDVSSNAKGLAGRYAGALYELAADASSVDAVLSDLNGLAELIDANDDLKAVISSPIYAQAEQASAMTAVLQKAGADSLTIKFVGAVAGNSRLFALPQIISAFAELVAKHRGQITAEVISAVKLDASRQKAVEKTVAKLAGAETVSLSLRVDPSLIGGLIVRIGSKMFDASIKTKLNRLEAAMKGVA